MSLIKTNAITTVAGKPILNSTGSTLQVVSSTGTPSLTTTSSTWQSSGFTATITPISSTSKILIQFHAWVAINNNSAHVAWTIFRNNSVNLDYSNGNLGMGNFIIGFPSGTIEGQSTAVWLDSPGTTSSTTYTVYFKSANNINTASFGGGRMCSMVLEEISA
jgi:hypothetical protein